jgi:hypothetical protein
MFFSRGSLNVSVPISLCFGLVAITCFPASDLHGATTNQIQFNRDIRPILSENCFACHGHDKSQRKAKLQLDVREVAVEKEAIVPGKPKESKLVEHILSDDPDEIMPPPKTHKVLTAAQKQMLQDWIAAGAEYEPHWAYLAPKRFSAPAVKNAPWVRNQIDSFVLNLLESKKISPSPEADKATLLRRVSLDLVGLPPSPEELKAFLADNRKDAYERQVDRLLASPHFGERMAVPWLDVVRYADTVGYHGDQNQDVFPYRDYVIKSFNENKPFDQFTIEQLGGDLMTNATTEDRIASCFNRLNMMTREGGAQPKEYIAKYQADRVRTVSMAWMGSTMGCCECHDHKYDPFLSKDFYQMEAFFADLKQWGVYADYGYTPNPDLKGVGNEHPFYPEIEVDSDYLKRRIAFLNNKVSNLYLTNSALLKSPAEKKNFDQWLTQSRNFLKQNASGWLVPQATVALKYKDTNIVSQTNFSVEANGTVMLSAAPRESLMLSVPVSNIWVSAIRLEISAQDESGQADAAKKPSMKKKIGTAFAPSLALKTADGKKTKLPFYFGDADHKEDRFSNGSAIVGVTELWQISKTNESQTAVWLLDKPFVAKAGQSLVLNLGNAALKSVRVSITPFPSADALTSGGSDGLRAALSKAAFRRSPADKVALARAYVLTTHSDTNLLAADRSLQSEMRLCRHGKARVMVSETRTEPLVTRVLARGNWQDESGEVVHPNVPHFLPQIPDPSGRRLTRLDLGKWLVATNNPLTARTIVNRLWRQFYGAGISAVVDDLGTQGEWPTHPELLDWLACEFMQPTVKGPTSGTGPMHAWDLKHIVRLMVTTSAYRQASRQRPDLKEIDPNNSLLAFETPRRLEAEFIRDNSLSIAGLINLDLGGPSAHPYQPAGYYSNIQFPERDYFPEKDARQYRRGVYAHWQRTFLQPMLANFDAPAREECVAARNVSNTPQQALTLLNDPTFVECSRVFAENLLAVPNLTDQQRLQQAFVRALSRQPKAKESTELLSFLQKQREQYSQTKTDGLKLLKVGIAPDPLPESKTVEAAAWTQVCRVILNLHETITIY